MRFLVTFFMLVSGVYADYSPQAQVLFREVKCPVCAGQSIEDSPMDEAVFLCDYIQERVEMGWSDDRIRQDLRSEFGDSILFFPPLTLHTLLLWGMPIVLGMGFVAFLGVRIRRIKKETS